MAKKKKKKSKNVGWICPRCDKVVSPNSQTCPFCWTDKNESKLKNGKKLLLEKSQ